MGAIAKIEDDALGLAIIGGLVLVAVLVWGGADLLKKLPSWDAIKKWFSLLGHDFQYALNDTLDMLGGGFKATHGDSWGNGVDTVQTGTNEGNDTPSTDSQGDGTQLADYTGGE